MNFKAQTKAKTLLDWLQAINAVADECIIDMSETDAVVVRVVDPANALLLDLRMPDHAWDMLETEPGRLGIDMMVLIERVKRFELDADITLTTKENLMVLTDGSARYTVKMLDPETLRKAPGIPELDLPAKITVDAKRLQRLVKNAASVSDHLRIGLDTDNQCMFVRAAGDTGDYEEPLSFDGGVIVLDKHRVNVSSLYSLDYTTETAKSLSGDVVIELGTDLPMLISFMLHDAIVCYVQAPRIEKD
jgi:proliferating cell nuclear antigen